MGSLDAGASAMQLHSRRALAEMPVCILCSPVIVFALHKRVSAHVPPCDLPSCRHACMRVPRRHKDSEYAIAAGALDAMAETDAGWCQHRWALAGMLCCIKRGAVYALHMAMAWCGIAVRLQV